MAYQQRPGSYGAIKVNICQRVADGNIHDVIVAVAPVLHRLCNWNCFCIWLRRKLFHFSFLSTCTCTRRRFWFILRARANERIKLTHVRRLTLASPFTIGYLIAFRSAATIVRLPVLNRFYGAAAVIAANNNIVGL